MIFRRYIMGCLCLLLLLVGFGTATAYAAPAQIENSQAPTSTPGTATPTLTETSIVSGAATATPSVPVTPGATGTATGTATTAGCSTTSTIITGSSADMMVNVDPQTAKGATARTYRLYVPVNYQPQQPFSLLLVFHGFGEQAQDIENYSKFSQLADTGHFIVAYPQGLHNKNGQTFWDSNSPSTEGVDEIAFVNKVLDDVEQKLCVNTTHIYAVGFSNGARTAGMLACRLSDRIAAIATLAGNFFDNEQGCNPGRPVAILNEHGTADDSVPYAGQQQIPGVQVWLQQWAKRDNCSANPTTFPQNAEGTAMEWMDCTSGVSIVHYRMDGEKHVWPKELNNAPTEMTIWQFLSQYSLSGTPAA